MSIAQTCSSNLSGWALQMNHWGIFGKQTPMNQGKHIRQGTNLFLTTFRRVNQKEEKWKYYPPSHCYVCRWLTKGGKKLNVGFWMYRHIQFWRWQQWIPETNEGTEWEKKLSEKNELMASFPLPSSPRWRRGKNEIHKPPDRPKASSNQDNITPLPFASHLSCLESVPTNVISTTMFGDLPVYSNNQACCLCTPRSFCSQSETSPRDQTVTALAPGVQKTLILLSDVIACEWCRSQTEEKNLNIPPSLHLWNRSLSDNKHLGQHTIPTEVLWVMNIEVFSFFILISIKRQTSTWWSHPLLHKHNQPLRTH